MSVIDWPNLKVSSFHWKRVEQQISYRGPFGGSVALVGASPLWEVELEGVVLKRLPAAVDRAFLEAIDGYTNQVALWNLTRPVPEGTLRGNPSLSGAVAAGAKTFNIAGTVDTTKPGNNMVVNSDFRVLPGAFTGVSALRGWTGTAATSTGVSVEITRVNPIGNIYPGGAAVKFSGIATSGTPRYTLSQIVVATPGKRYEASTVFGAFSNKVTLRIEFLDAFDPAANIISSVETSFDSGIQNLKAGSQLWLEGISPANTAAIRINLVKENSNSPATESYAFWNKVLLTDATLLTSSGSAPTPWSAKEANLKQGDMIGIGTGLTQQVLRIAVDTIDEFFTGVVKVTVSTPLRNAFANGTPVVWDRPRALFRQKELNDGIQDGPKLTKPWALSLIEDWRP